MSDTEIKHVAVLDDRGVYVGCDEVAPEQHKNGPNRVALWQKPDLAFGRYRLERANNRFGYVFRPVTGSTDEGQENTSTQSPVMGAVVRAILGLAGPGFVAKDDLKALREFASSVDARQTFDGDAA